MNVKGKNKGLLSIMSPVVEPLEDRLLLSYTASVWTAVNADRADLGNTQHTIQVRYVGNALGDQLDTTTLLNPHLQVTGPTGVFTPALVSYEIESPKYSSVFTPRPVVLPPFVYVATYSMVPPGGTWDQADIGDYRIDLLPNTIFDISGNAVTWIGGATVAKGSLELPATPLITPLPSFLIINDPLTGRTEHFDFYDAATTPPNVSTHYSLLANTWYYEIPISATSTNFDILQTVVDYINDKFILTNHVSRTPFIDMSASNVALTATGGYITNLTYGQAGVDGNAVTMATNLPQFTVVQMSGGSPGQGTDTFHVDTDVWMFGTSGMGIKQGLQAARRATFVDANGTTVMARMTGKGFAQIRWVDGGLGISPDTFILEVPYQTVNYTAGATTITVPTVTFKNVITVTTRKSKAPTDYGRFELSGIVSEMPIKTLTAKTTDLDGDATFSGLRPGAFSQITLGDVSNSIWDISEFTPQYSQLSLKAGRLRDVQIIIDPVRDDGSGGTFLVPAHGFSMIQVTDWVNTVAGVSQIPYILNLKTKGDLVADLTLGAVAGLPSLGKAIIGGWLRSDIIAPGDITSIIAKGIENSWILAGLRDPAAFDMATLSAADFQYPSLIGAVTIKAKGAADAFINSNIAAWNLGKIVVSNVDATNLGVPFGVAAHTIASYTRTFLGAKVFMGVNLVGIAPVVVDSQAPDYVCKLV